MAACDAADSFLQVGVQLHSDAVTAVLTHNPWIEELRSTWLFPSHLVNLLSDAQVQFKIHMARHSFANSAVSHLLELLEELGKGITVLVFLSFLLAAFYLLCGLPKKAPQHPTVKSGCPTSWMVFLSLAYALIYFATDQYVPSLPQMGHDLSGSQSVMSATVQFNFVVKAIAGLFTASLSDRIGRRPALVAGYLSNLKYMCLCFVPRKAYFKACLLFVFGFES